MMVMRQCKLIAANKTAKSHRFSNGANGIIFPVSIISLMESGGGGKR
jgi:hypothetical protein